MTLQYYTERIDGRARQTAYLARLVRTDKCFVSFIRLIEKYKNIALQAATASEHSSRAITTLHSQIGVHSTSCVNIGTRLYKLCEHLLASSLSSSPINSSWARTIKIKSQEDNNFQQKYFVHWMTRFSINIIRTIKQYQLVVSSFVCCMQLSPLLLLSAQFKTGFYS